MCHHDVSSCSRDWGLYINAIKPGGGPRRRQRRLVLLAPEVCTQTTMYKIISCTLVVVSTHCNCYTLWLDSFSRLQLQYKTVSLAVRSKLL